MQNELLYTPVYVAPTQEELRAMMGGAYAGCKAIRDFTQANYKIEERWRYSDKRDAFDCLIYDGDKRLCSLHLREGRLSLLVMFSQSECAVVEARLSALRPAVRACYRDRPTCAMACAGCVWRWRATPRWRISFPSSASRRS